MQNADMTIKLFKTDLHSVVLTCWWRVTCREGVSDEPLITATDGAVATDGAGGMDTTHPRTGVHALVPYTSLVHRTVRVDGALRLALYIGIALEAGQAGAGGRTLPIVTHSVDAARRRSTRVNRPRCCCYKKDPVKIWLRIFPLLQVIIRPA